MDYLESESRSTECGPSQKARAAPRYIGFLGLVISYANGWEGYSSYFGQGVGISGIGPWAHLLTFYGWSWNCHGALADVLRRAYSEALKVS